MRADKHHHGSIFSKILLSVITIALIVIAYRLVFPSKVPVTQKNIVSENTTQLSKASETRLTPSKTSDSFQQAETTMMTTEPRKTQEIEQNDVDDSYIKAWLTLKPNNTDESALTVEHIPAGTPVLGNDPTTSKTFPTDVIRIYGASSGASNQIIYSDNGDNSIVVYPMDLFFDFYKSGSDLTPSTQNELTQKILDNAKTVQEPMMKVSELKKLESVTNVY